MDEITTQLLTLLLAALAMLISLGKVWIGRIEARTEQDTAETQVNLLRQEIETMREKADIETRELVNDVMQRYMDENRELQERLRQQDAERAKLQIELEILRERLESTEIQLRQRISELEALIREKDERIAELERRLVRNN
jgi:predicted RNase H-like nuclease (RuvC/YqgF family)